MARNDASHVDGDVTQTRDIPNNQGIVNLGGNNTVRGSAVGEGATVINTGDRDTDRR